MKNALCCAVIISIFLVINGCKNTNQVLSDTFDNSTLDGAGSTPAPMPSCAEILASTTWDSIRVDLSKLKYILSGDISESDILKAPLPDRIVWVRCLLKDVPLITLSFTIDSTGKVTPLTIVRKSTGYVELDAKFEAIISRWKFKPSDKFTREGGISFTYEPERNGDD